MADNGFVMTIDDDASIPDEDAELLEPQGSNSNRKRKRPEPTHIQSKKQRRMQADAQPEAPNGLVKDDGAMDPDFLFEAGDLEDGLLEGFDVWELGSGQPEPQKKGQKRDIDDLVHRRMARKAAELVHEGEAEDKDEMDALPLDLEDELLAPDVFGMGANREESEPSEASGDSNEPSEESDGDSASVASPFAHPDDESPPTDDGSDAEERARREAFFAPEPKKPRETANSSASFQNMSLSRPILRGLASLNFSAPTPIQAKTVPVALLGKDIVGGAVTGSGKTAAFMIPILERLLFRSKKIPTTRVVVLVPTRELAVQCFNVAKKLAAFTDIGIAQVVGGFSLREQENVLRRRPDVVVATPGRFIDHMRNTAAFAVDGIEILVLDEADRMLDVGFEDELNEILTTLPRSRQTMLFSATMTSKVDDLIRVGLQRPVRLIVDAQRQTVGTLVQEFVRLRQGHEESRLAYLMHLATETYAARTIIFFRQKKEAHRVRVLFALCGLKAAELHGSMTQEQRLAAVEAFRAGTATHLLATDVASRGLDIRGVEAVINYEAPQSLDTYLHRVGRTARAGKAGRACTLAAEPDRKVVRAVVKAARAQGAKIASRTIPVAAAEAWARKLEAAEEEAHEVLAEEREDKELAQADMHLRRGENMIAHADEIKARPRRTWFASESDKKRTQDAARAALGGKSQSERRDLARAKKGKLSGKVRKTLDARRERKEGGSLYKKRKGDAAAAGKGTKDRKIRASKK